MGKTKMLTVTQKQSSIIIDKWLRNDDMSMPHEEFVAAIMKETDAEQWVVDKLVENWRYWHPNGANGGLRDAKDVKTFEQRAEEFMYVQTPLPKPKSTQKQKSAPEDGNGIVAQILKHAAEGKSVKEIIEMGFNRSTVYRQVGEWKQRNAAAAKETPNAAPVAAEPA
jgi:hypothetical protein